MLMLMFDNLGSCLKEAGGIKKFKRVGAKKLYADEFYWEYDGDSPELNGNA